MPQDLEIEGRAQTNTTHRSLLPSLQGSGKKIQSGYFIATPRTRVDGTALDAVILRVGCPVASAMPSGRVILGFRHEVDERYTLLGYYAAYSGNLLPTFRDNLLVPSSGVNKSKFHVTSIKIYRTYDIISEALAVNMHNKLGMSASVWCHFGCLLCFCNPIVTCAVMSFGSV